MLSITRLTLFAIVIAIYSCQDKSRVDGTERDILTDGKNEKKITDSVELYKVSPVFYSLLPDTANNFTDYNEMLDSLNKMYQRFTAFSNSLLDAASNKDSMIIEIAQAENRFRNDRSYAVFKLLKDKPKNFESIRIMSSFSVIVRSVSVEERIHEFNALPLQIKNSFEGETLLQKLNEAKFANNTGKSLLGEKDIPAQTAALGKVSFTDILTAGGKKYTILIFGASWCVPCRNEDKQLKAWYPLLDTSLFDVIGLSIDERTDRWQKYLEADEVPWNRYLIGKGWDNTLVKELGINSVPRNLLLDANGVVVYEHVDIRQILLKIRGLAVKE